jgi:hypothetical protein
VPLHPKLRTALEQWRTERAKWPGAAENPALFLNRRGGRLSTRISGLKTVSGRQTGVVAGLSRQNPSIRSPRSRNDQPSRSHRDGADGPRPRRGAAERNEAVRASSLISAGTPTPAHPAHPTGTGLAPVNPTIPTMGPLT